MKIIITVIVILVVIVGMVAGVGLWAKRGMVAADLTAVRVEPAARGDLVELVSAPGQVQPRTKVSISARVSARISELPHEEGSRVTKGDSGANPPVPASVLVGLDAKDLEASLKSAEAHRSAEATQIEVARARIAAQEAQTKGSQVSLAEAERDLKRQRDLLASKDVSQAVVDQAQCKVDELKAQLDSAALNLKADQTNLVAMQHNLDAAEAEIARARDALSYTTIASPIDGVVTRLNAKVGELVVTGTMNNPGTVILEVADLSQMLLVARADETVIGTVEVGQKATVRLQAYPDEVFEGKVETIALAHTDDRDGTKFFKTEILLKTGGRRIYSGLSGDVEIETRRHGNVIKVPSQAVLGRTAESLPAGVADGPDVDKTKTITTVVYRFLDGKAVVTPVSIGASDMTHTIIRSGIKEGEAIIVGPYKVLESLAHDQKVKSEQASATTRPGATRPATTQAVTTQKTD